MSNLTTKQILQEGPRNAVVKLTGVLDTSDVYLAPAVTVGDFSNNDHNMTLVGFRINYIEFSISPTAEVDLEFNSNPPQQLLPLAGRGKFGSINYGGIQPNQGAAGFDGSINLKTVSTPAPLSTAPTNYTVILEMVKLYK